MRTLVIHPKDATTDFLSVIYAGMECTVIDMEVSRREIARQIKVHDRIIMLGHGDELGMFGHDMYVINSSNAWYLRQKETVAIWCYADRFIRKHNIGGMYTGMIISELEEARLCSVACTEEHIQESNAMFADAARESINSSDFVESMHMLYHSQTNPVVQFNSIRVYQNRIVSSTK